MEDEWMEWVAAQSGQPLTVAPPCLSRLAHVQPSQGPTTPVPVGAGITDLTEAWYVSDSRDQSLRDSDGTRDQLAAQMSWPIARRDTEVSMMPQPQRTPSPRLAGEESALGGESFPEGR